MITCLTKSYHGLYLLEQRKVHARKTQNRRVSINSNYRNLCWYTRLCCTQNEWRYKRGFITRSECRYFRLTLFLSPQRDELFLAHRNIFHYYDRIIDDTLIYQINSSVHQISVHILCWNY